jgi:hypothetical protein
LKPLIAPVPSNDLGVTTLMIDAVYEGGRQGNAGDDPLGRLIGVSNSGGFRYRGTIERLELVALTTSLNDPDWPDGLDRETGVFTYYGDNKKPGRALHDTPRRGNQLLARIFEDAHGGAKGRARVPPIFLFASTGLWRDVEFLGLAVPGTTDLTATEDLVAVWKTSEDRRFQNYRAKFTVLDTAVIGREWIASLISGQPNVALAPAVWRDWIQTGRLTPLVSSRSIQHRTRAEQLPTDPGERAMITAVHSHFSDDPHGFEHCAAALVRMALPNVAMLDITRPSRDGGRDAIGKMKIGEGPGSILVDFALEAKCYGPENSVGVKATARLISRLRHRQFGILVTTSWLHQQAYQELKEDGHPVMVIAAVDIAAILKRHAISDVDKVRAWLTSSFPAATTGGAV